MAKTEPPSDPEAEKRLVGAALVDPAQVDALMARLSVEDFFISHYAQMYGAIVDLVVDNQPVSSQTVARRAKLPVADVAGCMEGADPEEATFWADRIIKTRKLRSLLAVGEAAIQAATSDPADADAAALRIEAMLSRDDAAASEAVDMKTGTSAALARIRRYIHEPDLITGLETGWHYLDRVLDGLQAGAVTSVYGRTGQFKTQFCQNIMWRLGSRGVPGAVFTTEMTHVQVMERLIQLEAGLNFRELRWQREMWRHENAIEDAVHCLEEYPIWINDRSLLDVGFIKGFLSRLKRTHGIQYAVVDLLDHVVSSRYRDNETKNEAFVMQQMKQLAKELDIHIMLTTHVAKPDRSAMPGSVINESEMKGSSAKSQDADCAISLVLVKEGDMGGWLPMNRDERLSAQRNGDPLHLMAGITKNRSGELADIPFIVRPDEGGRMMPREWNR